ncbi:hypothetical protein RJ40_05650 [Methanofollis aquaemaris]|uniref:Uncharacterized protein n=1 Tax=Methanofollis aquaemaris TaxID=126734 RepID=A0A8A3S507_9EURY|nr:hypothetical protein [Methanofollis aquaemaris]QSZ67013.1 hypothetical protein RJ40_05650 [Methanofollis aquaemaris]
MCGITTFFRIFFSAFLLESIAQEFGGWSNPLVEERSAAYIETEIKRTSRTSLVALIRFYAFFHPLAEGAAPETPGIAIVEGRRRRDRAEGSVIPVDFLRFSLRWVVWGGNLSKRQSNPLTDLPVLYSRSNFQQASSAATSSGGEGVTVSLLFENIPSAISAPC